MAYPIFLSTRPGSSPGSAGSLVDLPGRTGFQKDSLPLSQALTHKRRQVPKCELNLVHGIQEVETNLLDSPPPFSLSGPFSFLPHFQTAYRCHFCSTAKSKPIF
jgi:hypothetical protein